jgi:hypothetical protein
MDAIAKQWRGKRMHKREDRKRSPKFSPLPEQPKGKKHKKTFL